jgi:pimeloyl-ACP methyl ester carboxylesterase
MPLLTLARQLAGLVSLVILAAAVYLLATWFAGEWVADDNGTLMRLREPWRLWTGLVLLAWSVLGRFVILALAARRDTRPTRAARGHGRVVPSPTGAHLHVETDGPAGGTPIIFTHGWGMDSTFWNYARQDLGDRFRLILWDLPGLGRSRPSLDGDLGPAAFAADLESLIDQAGERPVLVGHSIGGITIQTLIRDRPEVMHRLAGVVLLNTTYTNPLKTMALSGLVQPLQPLLEALMQLTVPLSPLVALAKWQGYLSGSTHLAMRLGFGRHATRSQLEHVALLSTRAPPAVEAKGNLAMFHWDATGALSRLAVPALVVGGDLDIVTKLEASFVIAEESPRARLEVVEGANHMGPLERAETYNRLIGDFVLSVQPSASRDVRPPPAVAPTPEAPAPDARAEPATRPDGPQARPPR